MEVMLKTLSLKEALGERVWAKSQGQRTSLRPSHASGAGEGGGALKEAGEEGGGSEPFLRSR